jgi:hypothetical protein
MKTQNERDRFAQIMHGLVLVSFLCSVAIAVGKCQTPPERPRFAPVAAVKAGR